MSFQCQSLFSNRLKPREFHAIRRRSAYDWGMSLAEKNNAGGRDAHAVEIVAAITGASGAMYAQRFIQGLVTAGVHVHLVVSPLGRRLLHDELGMETIDLPALAGTIDHTITLYNYNDVGAKIASGSFLHDGMVIVPCSSNTLAEVAHGLGDNLISRAAAVALKERRRLVLAHREMPLSPMDVNNYKVLSDAGVILAPATPGFYLNPTTVGEVVDFVAGKLLDLVGVPHAMDTRWDPKVSRPPMKREIV
jgi:4-hydroxy-3-polyprenylbenzoate decarboxylase